jgi:hypothetical protein
LNPSRTFGFLLEDTVRLYAQRFERRSGVLGLTLAQCKLLVHAFAGIPIRHAELMIELLERIQSNLASAEPLPVASQR